MRTRSILMAGSAVAVAAAGVALAYAWHSEIAPIPKPTAASFDTALVRQGATLALIGDCRTCHTTPGGRVFAGGLAMPTPFGTLYSTNITPDPETGIGTWSEDAFKRAMREGVDREGRHLYPAFPYDHFTLTSDEDIKALYAFFMSREPVKAKAPANELPFPINIRLVLAGWKLLFLRETRLQPDPLKDAVWNRGRYLVEGLGHCGACHTPRNLMGAEKKSRAYEGGEAEGLHAYALGKASQAPVPWNAAAYEQYLAEGFHPQHGVARGPMAPVVENLASVPREEVAAMATYLASLAPEAVGQAKTTGPSQTVASPPSPPQSAGVQTATPAATSQQGSRLYATTCASCHDAGRPQPLGAINLSLSTAVAGESPENLVNLILDGIPAASGATGPVMPGFATTLSDRQITDIAAHLRAAAGKPVWPNLGATISSARSARQTQQAKR
ncbi:c-type cytochrome (plasmid) [Bosea sp. F3-2]|uniref:c-type cytochrome n=1 Tax=Bosea sp. F3-2 TaxID=2599640 RepID=UPI0011EF9D55|nr:cytochrome c [Bosea sp. F3-2]QEL26953.1 c-type cytochrome [Bosea sp. F3-2]